MWAFISQQPLSLYYFRELVFLSQPWCTTSSSPISLLASWTSNAISFHFKGKDLRHKRLKKWFPSAWVFFYFFIFNCTQEHFTHEPRAMIMNHGNQTKRPKAVPRPFHGLPILQLGLPPRGGFRKWSKWPWNTIHAMPCRNPRRLHIHLAFTHSFGPSSVVWSSELGPAPPFPPMGVLKGQWSRALSLVDVNSVNLRSDDDTAHLS